MMFFDKRTKEHNVFWTKGQKNRMFFGHMVNDIENFFFWAAWQAATAK